MTDTPKRPPLGLHETVDNHPIQIVVEKMPGVGHCPACRERIEIEIALDGALTSPRCPHCNTTLTLRATPAK